MEGFVVLPNFEFAGMMHIFVSSRIHACKDFCIIWIIQEKKLQAELSKSKIFPNNTNGFCMILHGNSREFVATMCMDGYSTEITLLNRFTKIT